MPTGDSRTSRIQSVQLTRVIEPVKVRLVDAAGDNHAASVVPSNFDVSGASPQTAVGAQGAGKKIRLNEITVSVDTTGLVTISNGIARLYMTASTVYNLPMKNGKIQTTANTAITVANAGGGNVTANGTYSVV